MQTPSISIETINLSNGFSFDLLRLDQTDRLISGNKWFKLLPNLTNLNVGDLVASFGGPHSNHIHALAYAAQNLGLKSVGFIRGEPQSTPTLEDAQSCGMQLIFIDRDTYREKPTQRLADQYHLIDPCWIPEGGSNLSAVEGCAAIWHQACLQNRVYDQVYVAVGSGGTLAGLVAGAPDGVELIGLSALGSLADLNERVSELLTQAGHRQTEQFEQWSIEVALQQRYGKVNAELAATQVRAQTLGLLLDPIYTLRVFHYLNRQYLKYRLTDKRLLMVHTGGLQGLRAQQQRIHRLANEFVGPLPF
jgi:1-aminocyclopropane-1-carboxylate deaminase